MTHKQSIEELNAQLKEQVYHLYTSNKGYDDGNLSEAKRISASLRILLKDRGQSKSILSQLGIKEKIKFYDSAGVINLQLDNAQCNLISLKFELFSGKSNIEPLCYCHQNLSKQLFFDEWWNQIIYFDKKSDRKLTRQSIILTMAEQDGGTHVDPNIEETYASIAKRQQLGWKATINGIKINVANSIPAMIRQISLESLQSLENYFPNNFFKIPINN